MWIPKGSSSDFLSLNAISSNAGLHGNTALELTAARQGSVGRSTVSVHLPGDSRMSHIRLTCVGAAARPTCCMGKTRGPQLLSTILTGYITVHSIH